MAIEKVKKGLKLYFKSQISLVVVNILIFSLLLFFFKLKYAFIFGLMTGLLSVIPVFGILISALIVFIFSFLDGQSFSSLHPFLEGMVFISVYIILNQLIDFVISPYIMGTAVKISPFVLLFTVILATSVFGIAGAIFAVPVLIVIKTVFDSKK